MATDEEYMSFLDKANADLDEGRKAQEDFKSTSAEEFRTTEEGVKVPQVLKDVAEETFYVSDADEPFVPVALKWDGGARGELPDEGMFCPICRLFLFFVACPC
jgi:hypothetical protein